MSGCVASLTLADPGRAGHAHRHAPAHGRLGSWRQPTGLDRRLCVDPPRLLDSSPQMPSRSLSTVWCAQSIAMPCADVSRASAASVRPESEADRWADRTDPITATTSMEAASSARTNPIDRLYRGRRVTGYVGHARDLSDRQRLPDAGLGPGRQSQCVISCQRACSSAQSSSCSVSWSARPAQLPLTSPDLQRQP